MGDFPEKIRNFVGIVQQKLGDFSEKIRKNLGDFQEKLEDFSEIFQKFKRELLKKNSQEKKIPFVSTLTNLVTSGSFNKSRTFFKFASEVEDQSNRCFSLNGSVEADFCFLLVSTCDQLKKNYEKKYQT